MDKLDEIHLDAYENARIYKERSKLWHDELIMRRDFQPGQQVLLFNSRLKLFLGKLKSKWSGPFKIVKVMPYGVVELKGQDGSTFQVNEHRVKAYYGDDLYHIGQLILADPSL